MSEPEKKVADIMSKDVTAVDLNVAARDCAKVMSKKGVSGAVVTREGAAVGIVTERDLVSKVLADPEVDPAKVLARDIMSTPLITVDPSATLTEAAELMAEYKVRRLVVVDGSGALSGIVTTGDIARTIAQEKDNKEPTLNAIARYSEGAESGPYR